MPPDWSRAARARWSSVVRGGGGSPRARPAVWFCMIFWHGHSQHLRAHVTLVVCNTSSNQAKRRACSIANFGHDLDTNNPTVIGTASFGTVCVHSLCLTAAAPRGSNTTNFNFQTQPWSNDTILRPRDWRNMSSQRVAAVDVGWMRIFNSQACGWTNSWLQSIRCGTSTKALTTATPSKPQFLCGKEGTVQKSHISPTKFSNTPSSCRHVGMASKQRSPSHLGKLNNVTKVQLLVLSDRLQTVLSWEHYFPPLIFGPGLKSNWLNFEPLHVLLISHAPPIAVLSWTGWLLP